MLGGFRVYAQFMGVGASSTFGYMRSSVDVWCLALRWPWWLDEAAEPAPFATIAEAPTNGNTAAEFPDRVFLVGE